jgi:CRISPR-associated protein Csm5
MSKVTITALTPVHIGNGVTYNRDIDFVVDNNKVFFVDPAKVLNALGGKEYVQQWTQQILSGTPLLDFLRKNRGLSINPDDIADRSSLLKTQDFSSTQLKEQYRVSLKGACIPGSSLKGSLRTAIFNYLLDDKTLDSIKTTDLFEERTRWRNNQQLVIRNWNDKAIEKRLFGNTANNKSTRFLKVGDIHFENLTTEVYEMKILNLEYDRRTSDYVWQFKPSQQLLVETIPAGAVAGFQLTIDHDSLKRNLELQKIRARTDYLESEQKLCEVINNHTRSLLEYEIADWQQESDVLNDAGLEMLEQLKELLSMFDSISPHEAIVRIGGHSGWTFTTGGWVKSLSEDSIPAEDYGLLRKQIQKKTYENLDLWPKTRKMNPEGGLFGFVKISFIQ